MSLHVYDKLDQGSEAWHDVRRGMVTASAVGKLLTPTLKVADNDTSRALTATLVAERLTGFTEETGMTADMFRGVYSEPFARDAYSQHYAEAVEVGFMQFDGDGWTLGYSPDGLVGDEGLIEVKAPRAKTHLNNIINGGVPNYYLAQCQAGLLVSGRKWLDFISYVSGMPLHVHRVYPDPEWFGAIIAATKQFELNAKDMVSAYRLRAAHLPMTERISTDLELVI